MKSFQHAMENILIFNLDDYLTHGFFLYEISSIPFCFRSDNFICNILMKQLFISSPNPLLRVAAFIFWGDETHLLQQFETSQCVVLSILFVLFLIQFIIISK